MTMGALHEGHAELVREARRAADSVLVTLFVNPLQFGAGEDLDRYPRTLAADLALLDREGADVVFAPTPDVVYPDGPPLVRVSAGPLGEVLEGASRPGHFDGVLTVVCKLLHLTRPHVALFGQNFRIVLPLLKPGLLAGWIYIMIVSIRELSSSILLYSPGTEVISIIIWELWENGQYVELSALGVMFILMLFVLVMISQAVGKKFGIKE